MTMKPAVIGISYEDPAKDFSAFAGDAGSFFLDASLSDIANGRYSFWGVQPRSIFESREGFISVDGHTQIHSPVEALKEFYHRHCDGIHEPYLPFAGGLVGFLSYEWGAALENIEANPKRDLHLPDGWFGFYETVVVYDHLEKTCKIVSPLPEPAEQLATQISQNRSKCLALTATHVSKCLALTATLSKEDYLGAVERVREYLRAGDCYQVNLAQQFSIPLEETPWKLYLRLRSISPAPYAAYINGGNFQILSASPESFLESKVDGTLITQPIKGTRPRSSAPSLDDLLKAELECSAKDTAELLMITDLERNDLGRISEPGSVTVPHLQKITSLPQVHHLYSVVQGNRRKDLDLVDCLAATLPGGSITGAPKIRAMEIIRELEPVQRGPYTGILGWMGPANTGHFNIAIRTMVIQDSTCYFYAGGGIVIDSDPEGEYEEMLTKASGMMKALKIS